MAIDNLFAEVTSARYMALVVESTKLEKQICATHTGQLLYDQFFLAATLAGANYENAWANESMTGFIAKMQMVSVELQKLIFIAKVIINTKIISSDNEVLGFIFIETNELMSSASKSIATAKTKITNPELRQN